MCFDRNLEGGLSVILLWGLLGNTMYQLRLLCNQTPHLVNISISYEFE